MLQPDGLNLLVAMGKQAAASLQEEFGLPLGLIITPEPDEELELDPDDEIGF